VSTTSQPDNVARKSAGHPEPAPSSSRRWPRNRPSRAAARSACSRRPAGRAVVAAAHAALDFSHQRLLRDLVVAREVAGNTSENRHGEPFTQISLSGDEITLCETATPLLIACPVLFTRRGLLVALPDRPRAAYRLAVSR